MTEITYEDAGVNLAAGRAVTDSIKRLAKSTFDHRVLKGIGLFSGFYELDVAKYKQPVIVSSIDGIGTKVKVAQMMGVYDTIGEDLVNHSCNDIMVSGADPLFFMDYLAADRLEPRVIDAILRGVINACKRTECALIGGETAEMPGVYKAKSVDVVGAITGVVEKTEIIDGSHIAAGDNIIGLASNGLHTNGYSLVRKILFEHKNYSIESHFQDLGCTLGEELLRVHLHYGDAISAIRRGYGVKGIGHITGGGIVDNTSRLLREGLLLDIDWSSWQPSPIFAILQLEGSVPDPEMRQTFNLGIGLTVIVGPDTSARVLDTCRSKGHSAQIIGTITRK